MAKGKLSKVKNGAAGADPAPHALTLQELAEDVLGQGSKDWFERPNPQFADRRPKDLVGTEEEYKVYRLLNAAAHGLF